ncbi:unnamed protein product [Periconia digitata]|uniref:Uncharacterized protein n=1 Tax=Periconia digitata TaxID=1303443 RepID=A0A9W4XUL8_9PLEO|nr:unnamed protein product [Periconia digitata]
MCTLDPSWTFDSQACRALPTDGITTTTTTTIGKLETGQDGSTTRGTITKTVSFTMYSRHIGFSSSGNSTYLTQPAPTQFNSCLPGPSSLCGTRMVYMSAESCPTPYVEALAEVAGTRRTAYCCLDSFAPIGESFVRALPMTTMKGQTLTQSGNITTPFVSGETPSITSKPLCIYSWEADEDKSTFPQQSDRGYFFGRDHAHQLMMQPLVLIQDTTVSKPLSTDTKMYIGIGVGLGVLFLIGVIITIVLLLRRVRKLRQGKTDIKATDEPGLVKAELPGEQAEKKISDTDAFQSVQIDSRSIGELQGDGTKAELGGPAVAEVQGSEAAVMAGNSQVYEMQDTSAPAEMMGDAPPKNRSD